MNEEAKAPELVAIGSVARETGLSRDILRVWERRYGFPQPTRNAKGARLYPREQIERLQQIRAMVERGFRPGKLIAKKKP